MDFNLIVEREKFFAECGDGVSFHTILKQPFVFQSFYHLFVDEEEKKRYVEPESPATGLYYMFKRSPPTADAGISMLFPTNKNVGVIFMYLFFYNTKMDQLGFVCAPVKNNLEFGSKHLTLVAKVMEVFKDTRLDLIFVQAGEMMFQDDGTCVFNHSSGTYTQSRLDVLEREVNYGMENEYLIIPLKDFQKSLNDWMFTKSLFRSKSPMTQFEFSSSRFVRKYLPLVSMLTFLPSEEYYPYVIPNNTNRAFMFEKAVRIISTFVNLKEMEPKVVNVNTLASEQVAATTSISVKQIDDNSGPLAQKNSPLVNLGYRVTVLPYKNDLKLALGVLKSVGARKLNYEIKYKAINDSSFDFLKLEGKTFHVDGVGQLKVNKFLACSNDIVYMCKMNDADVVLKITSLYPFSDKYFNTGSIAKNLKREMAFYGTEIHSFIVPGHAGLGTVYPYLGRTITSLSNEERERLYPKFKEQYTDIWLSKTLVPNYTNQIVSFYNDIKPENTTIDKDGNFHLIDVDEYAYTPAYYGPTNEKTFFNQMFGVFMVIYWFKTGESPFKNDSTNKHKLTWVEKELNDPEIKELFNTLMNMGLSNKKKREMIKQQTKLKT